MAQTVIRIMDLPDKPVEAAAKFYAEYVPLARDVLDGRGPVAEIEAIALVFPAAGLEHRAWRLAAVQDLAREAAPRRVNGLTGSPEDAIDRATDWLADAAGITGQVLEV